MSRFLNGFAMGLFALTVAATLQAEEMETKAPQGRDIQWHDDYAEATNQAVRQGKMLFLLFHHPKSRESQAFMANSLRANVLAARDHRYVWARIPTDARIQAQGQDLRVLDAPAFREMAGFPGIAIVDYQNRRADLYGRVVSAFPLTGRRFYSAHSLATILDLPPGTLTQRTMVYAVRTHPEGPASTHGQLSSVLSSEAQQHSSHQASILLQGHHAWDSRFHRINSRLPSNLTAQEVVAESWPNKDLVDACIDCVDSWRQSPGHWSAVSGRHRMFGYDIKRGRNGIWYATGLFAR
jgi:hypothetical protein